MHQIVARHILQLVGNEPIALGTFGLVFNKTLQRVALFGLNILHLEHDSKVAATHHGVAATVDHRPQLGQGREVVLGQLDGLNVF